MNQSAKGGHCGCILAESPSIPAAARQPCPACGSLARSFAVAVAEQVYVGDHLAALQEREGRAIAFSETTRRGTASSASFADGESVQFALSGRSPQGEQDTLTACGILIQRLNADGATWLPPVAGQQNADCVSPNRTGIDIIRIQVVRAVAESSFWEELGRHGAVARSESITQVVEAIRTALAFKADAAKIPSSERAGLILALDATRLPAHVLDDVISSFRQEHAGWASGLGFSAVWIVGPSMRLTHRLDRDNNAA